MTLPEALLPLAREPERSGVFLDFDGTLSPIVDDPSAAVPLPGTVEVLGALQERFAEVAVISGRPVAYLRSHLGDDLLLVGLYGLERLVDGEVVTLAEADAFRPLLAEVAADAEQRFGEDAEDKGLSLTVHFRRHPELEEDVVEWAEAIGIRTGLLVRAAKASVELHPPIRRDKGTVVAESAAGLDAVAFVGDDVGDLPAFDALDRLAARGVATVRVVVETAETPAAMRQRADVLVPGPEGALELLRELATP